MLRASFLNAGDFFGQDGFLRLGIGAEPDVFASGLDRIVELLEDDPRLTTNAG